MARRNRINKRASLDDLTYIMGVLLVFGLLLLILGTWTNSFNDKIQAIDKIPAAGKTAVSQVNNIYGDTLDNGFLLLAIGLSIGAIIFAMLIIVHPIFFVFYVIMLAIVIFVSGVFSNIYQQAALNPNMAVMASKLLFTSHILNYLPFITAILGTIIAIVMYKNWRDQ